MAKKGLCVIGDIHTSDNPAKYKQCSDFFKWFLGTEYNSDDWDKLFLGDIFDEAEPSNQCIGLVLGFLYSLKGLKYIITGNHDRNPATNALEIYLALDSVTLITKDTEMDIEGYKCLMLPHMDTENLGLPPMTQYYNQKIKDEYSKHKYDFIFHHLEDDSKHFSSDFVDTSSLKGKFLAGHIHTADVLEGGHYLGSVCKNSKDEAEDTKYLACISYSEKKKVDYVEVPSFLEYDSLEYPNLPESYDKTTLYTITKAPTKRDALMHYEKEFENHGSVFYPLKIINIRNEIIYEEGGNGELQSERDYLNLYGSENNIKQSIIDKCMELLG